MDMEVFFPGGKKVAARYRGHTIITDQVAQAGGEDSAPSPTELFLASIATCAGFYVLSFCQQRNISIEGVRVVQHMEVDRQTHLVGKIGIEIQLPPDFPEQYKPAVIRAANLCTVKRHLQTPPQIDVYTTTASGGSQA